MFAKDIMTTHVVTIRPDATLNEAIRLMLQNRISGLPVVDNAGQLVGVLTEGDLLRRAELGTETRRPRWIEFLRGPGRLAVDYVETHARKIDEIMTKEVLTINEDAPLDDIVTVMEKHRVKRVPVMRDGKLIGIVSRANLLHALARVAAEAKPTTADDTALRTRILDQVTKEPWAPVNSINLIVRDGIVDLNGVILDERERLALRVAIENTPGVKQVRDHLIWVEPVSGFVFDPESKQVDQMAAVGNGRNA